MVADVSTAQRIADIDEALATSPEAPIVLGDTRDLALRDAVAPGQSRVGVMLPYSGIHHLLFSPHPKRLGDWVPEALVMTSGNLADEPICIDAADAELRLTGIADAFLHHDRGIHVSCDDSVVCADGQPVRRSRGFAPLPVHLPRQARPTLAVGGELKTTLCVASGSRAWMSQHIGDTANLETLDLLARTADTLTELVRVHPEVIVADMHPAYLSRRWADERARQTGAELRLVQHHHAHVASLMAEHGIASDEPIIGFAFDGTGFGRDGSIWGGEVLLATYAQADRIGHLAPVSLPGGDAAIRRPTRTALAHLYAAGIAWDDDLPAVSASDDTERRVIGRMVLTGTGCTPTTSMGRLFDAVSSLLGVCQDTAYEGQAAIELEALAGSEGPRWDFSVAEGPEGGLILDPRPALGAAVGGLRAGVPTADLAFAFHAAVADAVAEAAAWARDRHGVSRVGLTGGVFANRLLTRLCQERLRGLGMTPLVHRTVPPNDGGLALGQAAVAAAS
jgi:hydrogenase maturation protein HypF